MNPNYLADLIRRGKMRSLAAIVILVIATSKCNAAKLGDVQTQQTEDDLENQFLELKRNVSDLWSYVYELRTAVGQHLTHLRQHQVELEVLHKGSHPHSQSGHDRSHSRSDDHHHEDDHHSTDDHHHSDDHSHAEGSGHGHDDDHSHSHSGEQHSHDHDSDHHSPDHSSDHHSPDHSSDHHSHDHSSEHHSHGSGDNHSHSRSHSHDHSREETGSSHSIYHRQDHAHASSTNSHDHGHGSSTTHDHGSSTTHDHEDEGQHDHKDSHEKEEKEDVQQKQEPEPTKAPVSPSPRAHHHHHHSHHSQGEAHQTPTSDPLRLFPGLAHHHHELTSDQRGNITDIPKYSEYNKYRFATCNMQPSRAIPEDQQQEVKGQVNFWQKKTGGPMGIHVRLEGFTVSGHGDHEEMQQQMSEAPTHHEGGHKHGMHVHTNGDLSNGCQTTGPHYNPKMTNHGGPRALVRHVGDLGNIECDEHGVANILFSDDIISLIGQYSIIGKSLVIHTGQDDYGLKPNDIESTKTGNAGTRIACCIIESIDKLPFRSYKALKTATIHQNR